MENIIGKREMEYIIGKRESGNFIYIIKYYRKERKWNRLREGEKMENVI